MAVVLDFIQTQVFLLGEAAVGTIALLQILLSRRARIERHVAVDDDQFEDTRDLIDVRVNRAEQSRQIGRNGQNAQGDRRAETDIRAVDGDVNLVVQRPLYHERIGSLRAVRPGDAGTQIEGLHRRLSVVVDDAQRVQADRRVERDAGNPAGLLAKSDAHPGAILGNAVCRQRRPRRNSCRHQLAQFRVLEE